MKCCLHHFEELGISSVMIQCFIPFIDLSFFLTLLTLLTHLTLSFKDIEKYLKCMAKYMAKAMNILYHGRR